MDPEQVQREYPLLQHPGADEAFRFRQGANSRRRGGRPDRRLARAGLGGADAEGVAPARRNPGRGQQGDPQKHEPLPPAAGQGRRPGDAEKEIRHTGGKRPAAALPGGRGLQPALLPARRAAVRGILQLVRRFRSLGDLLRFHRGGFQGFPGEPVRPHHRKVQQHARDGVRLVG